MNETLRRTPLYQEHVERGGKMVLFAGFEMPVQYEPGITAEHRMVREAAGLFDVSHMGEFEIRGPQALDLVQYLTVNDVTRVQPGQAQYSALCLEDGGVVDDLLVYRFHDHFMLVVNAANRSKDLSWVRMHARHFDAEVKDRSDETALLALQGPRSAEVLAPHCDVDLGAVRYYGFRRGGVAGCEAIISRTGYTGEDGFELYVAPNDAVCLWRRILEVGSPAGVGPVGLGARDSLRLEMGYSLYGNDLDEKHTPLESGLGWIVYLDKGAFIGREALLRQREEGISERLVGLELTSRGFPRHGYDVLSGSDKVGTVTSGTVSPSTGRGVALARVRNEVAAPGTPLSVEIRGKAVRARVERPPFYKQGTVKK